MARCSIVYKPPNGCLCIYTSALGPCQHHRMPCLPKFIHHDSLTALLLSPHNIRSDPSVTCPRSDPLPEIHQPRMKYTVSQVPFGNPCSIWWIIGSSGIRHSAVPSAPTHVPRNGFGHLTGWISQLRAVSTDSSSIQDIFSRHRRI